MTVNLNFQEVLCNLEKAIINGNLQCMNPNAKVPQYVSKNGNVCAIGASYNPGRKKIKCSSFGTRIHSQKAAVDDLVYNDLMFFKTDIDRIRASKLQEYHDECVTDKEDYNRRNFINYLSRFPKGRRSAQMLRGYWNLHVKK